MPGILFGGGACWKGDVYGGEYLLILTAFAAGCQVGLRESARNVPPRRACLNTGRMANMGDINFPRLLGLRAAPYAYSGSSPPSTRVRASMICSSPHGQLPPPLHAISVEGGIDTDDGNVFRDGLGGRHAVERVLVVHGQR